MCANRSYFCRLVDQCHTDLVSTDNTGVNEGVRSSPGGGIKPRHKVLDGAVGSGIVLNLHQTDNIRIESSDRADDFVTLASELCKGTRAACGGESAAKPIAVEVV